MFLWRERRRVESDYTKHFNNRYYFINEEKEAIKFRIMIYCLISLKKFNQENKLTLRSKS